MNYLPRADIHPRRAERRDGNSAGDGFGCGRGLTVSVEVLEEAGAEEEHG